MSSPRHWLLGLACVGLAASLTIETVRMRALTNKVASLASAARARQTTCEVLRSWLELLPSTSFQLAKSFDAQLLADIEYRTLVSRPVLESCGVDYPPFETLIHDSRNCFILPGNLSCEAGVISRVLDAYPSPALLPTAE